ncbi:hypothetical protein OG21DRAFT_1492171 [Imleria badia]|nr:hypothetical protein OG21DRAFT_1492171 [Imleria badia]
MPLPPTDLHSKTLPHVLPIFQSPLTFAGEPSHLTPFLTAIAEFAVQAGVLFSSRIKLAIRYANLDEAKFWEMLPEATAPSQDWMSFVDILIGLYPRCDASPNTDHITITHTDPKSITVHNPDSISLRPIIPDALSTTAKPDINPNDITINPETDHICHHITDPNTRTEITTTSDTDTITNSDRPTTNTNTTTPTITDSDHTVSAMDNLANTTSATETPPLSPLRSPELSVTNATRLYHFSPIFPYFS